MRQAVARRSTPPAARRAGASSFGLLLPALLGGLLAAAPVGAQVFQVTVSGLNYRVTRLAGAYNANSTANRPRYRAQPWFTNSTAINALDATARSFAAALRNDTQ